VTRARRDYDPPPIVIPGEAVVRHLMLVVPGLADAPLSALGGRTPLAVSSHPAFDRLASRGRLGTVELDGGEQAGSIVGLPALLGLDARALALRRGPLEATGLGVTLAPDALAFRLNFLSTFDGTLADTRAGHVSDQEATLLLATLRAIDLAGLPLVLHAGAGYRHLAVVERGASLDVATTPPQELLGKPLREHLPRGRDAAPLVKFLEEAARVLPGNEVNRVRVDLGENPADAVWLWGEGSRRPVPPLGDAFGGPAAMVAAAPLVRGLALELGMTCPKIDGVTADEQSDLARKAAAALELAATHRFVAVHAAAVNEASRSGDARRKVAAIERVDRELLAPLLAWVEAGADERRLLVASDHATSADPQRRPQLRVPFALFGGGLAGVRERRFDEEGALAADLQLANAGELLDWFRRPGVRSASA
jgi:2,3-bisphosphoglycerate-independent phosphoglycerate mutase